MVSEPTTQLGIIVLILVVGFVSQLIAEKTEIPSIVYLLSFGIILGPEVLGVINPSGFMSYLEVLVALSVAIIVFEGGINLDLRELRHLSRPIFGLVTVGVSVTFVLASLITFLILDLGLAVSMLFGALITATGPTVTRPLLRQIHVEEDISSLLDFEGVLNDPISALLAVAVFSMIVSGGLSLTGLHNFVAHLGFGIFMGLVGGFGMVYFFKLADFDERYIRFSSIIFALAIFISADYFLEETGIMAIAIASIIVGSHDFRHKEAVLEFKEDVSIILISIIFILLPSLLGFNEIMSIIPGGIIIVLLILFLIRPLAVYLSTLGSSLERNEIGFVSLIGPKGVVPAAMATYFSLQMNDGGTILGLVFLTIIIAVIFTGITANRLAEYFDVIPMEMVIAGGGGVGGTLARRLNNRGENVVVIDQKEELGEELRKEGIRYIEGSACNKKILEEANLSRTKYLVAATNDDEANLMACQIAKTKFNVDEDRIVARVNNDENFEAFEDLGIRSMNPDLSSAVMLENLIERPEIFNMMEIGRKGDIVEIEIQNEEIIGKKLKNICGPGIEKCKVFPRESLIVLVKRKEKDLIPHGDLEFQKGDRLTILGKEKAVQEAQKIFQEPQKE
ncbi:MAG: NhaP-type Na+/H+ and K+/H+ antiporter [Candidatus Methanohalarchaeum thermophilum]|uniref:NhaP-type Na+/H+ and K+/H+ antiporter n=1 Tax=Methanohalarchaeum thermophilum TaxID=1903181 RepID=A0A1Q6DT18_METT1|nr:MAG: NhaP-type Na+/H+ and K+/H+ antiporter [Candidatus Methanohalarchaeum thermophilum]